MVFRDLSSSRCRFLCLGPDATRYLNGQVSQDVRLVAAGRVLPACLTNAKGRLEAELMIAPAPDGFLIDGPAELQDFLALRLEKYLIADDCRIEDATASLAQFHLREISAPPADWPAIPSVRDGHAGWDVTLPSASAAALRAELAQSGRAEDEAAAEDDRIRRGVPAWGSELDADTLPPEAGLEATHIHYHKGCYIGQEIISRLKSVGQVARRLCRIRPLDGRPLPVGAVLVADDTDPARPLGRVTSATRDGQSALAFVRRPHHAPGVRLSALPNGESALSIPVEILEPISSSSHPSVQP